MKYYKGITRWNITEKNYIPLINSTFIWIRINIMLIKLFGK